MQAGGNDHGSTGETIDCGVDATAAGDIFYGDFMVGMIEGRSLHDCARIRGTTAAEVISHSGARPEADLKALVKTKLG